MTKWDFLPRAFLAAILAITAPICALAQQPQLKIFDAHLHYNDDTVTVYSVDEALDIFRRNGVAGILANSLPNGGTRLLVEAQGARPVGRAVHSPVSRPGRHAALVQ